MKKRYIYIYFIIIFLVIENDYIYAEINLLIYLIIDCKYDTYISPK